MIMFRRIAFHSLRSLGLAIAATAAVVAGSQLCGPSVEGAPPQQSGQSRTVDWYYWMDTGTRSINRSRLDGSGGAEIIADSSEISTATDFAVDGSHVYWTDNGHNEIRRKAADGTGSFETLVDSGDVSISTPQRIAIDGLYVYWSDNIYQTINRVSLSGGSVTTLADSTDGVSNPTSIVVGSGKVYWGQSNSIREVSRFGGTVTTLASSPDVNNPHQIRIGRFGNWVYWVDRSNFTIKRVQTYGSHTVETLASNTGTTPVDDPIALALDPNNDRVYWLDEDDVALRRMDADGTAGTFETLNTATGSSPTDLAVSPDGNWVYWLSSGRVKRMAADGAGGVIDMISTGVSSPQRIHVVQGRETIPGSCITNAGRLPADYGAHEWDAEIDGDCERVFYTFQLTADTDLRVTAQSHSIDPLPILRQGGLDGAAVALTTTSSGNSTPYVYAAKAGQYTLEMARGMNSSQTAGAFAASVQTQPMLEGCDVNLGALSTEEIGVFGGFDADCGDHRDYFFYLEYQASVSVSASATGFTPRIELRPASASDTSTATATATANPADIYQAVASGAYRLQVENIAAGGTYALTFQAFGLPPPTRTPIPTPTPRFQPNQDVRLEPDPRGVAYESGQVYQFRVEGGEGSFPAIVRSSNDTAFRLTTGQADQLDCSAGSEVSVARVLQVVYVHVCATAAGSTIEVVKESDYSLLAQYPVYVAGETPTAPGAVPAPGGYVKPAEDRIGLSVLINVLCQGANVECQVDLIRNGIGVAGSVALFVVPTQVARGKPSGYAYGIGVVAFVIGLLLANFAIGLPMYWAGITLICVFALFGAGAWLKFRRVGS